MGMITHGAQTHVHLSVRRDLLCAWRMPAHRRVERHENPDTHLLFLLRLARVPGFNEVLLFFLRLLLYK